MSGFKDVLEKIGFGAGVVTGGPSQLKAAAGAVAVQGKINSYLDQVGRKIGATVGPDLFRKIAGGAEVTAATETKAFVNTHVLTSETKTKITLGLAALLGVLAYFFYRRG